jgi:hypothetical protein
MEAKLKAKLFGLVALFALASVSQHASAAVLYDNGPINGTISGYAITDGYAVSNSFTLSQDSIVTGVNFGAWVLQSASLTASLTAVDWAITTIPSSYPINGSASVTTEPTGIPHVSYTILSASFSTGSVSLAPGSYYLVLQNAVSTIGGSSAFVFWDLNNGPSTASQNTGVGAIGSESFQIIGSSIAATPLPAALPLFASGLGALGLLGWRRKRKAAA